MSKAAAAGEDRRLTAVEVAGFKSAREKVRVNFRDITILAGANSSGKSTVMQPLLLIKQTIEKPFDPGGLAIDGPLVRFTHADQFFSHTKVKAEKQTFSVAVEQSDRRIWLLYGRGDSSGMRAMEMRFREDGKENSWSYNQYLKLNEQSNLKLSEQSIMLNSFQNLKIVMISHGFSTENPEGLWALSILPIIRSQPRRTLTELIRWVREGFATKSARRDPRFSDPVADMNFCIVIFR